MDYPKMSALKMNLGVLVRKARTDLEKTLGLLVAPYQVGTGVVNQEEIVVHPLMMAVASHMV